jgi:HPt (histidine-containing phosphotransfer) domain-containing protein
MPGVYGVVVTDIAAELPGVVPGGVFTQAMRPSIETVTSWIADADSFANSVVEDALARISAAGALDASPGTTDRLTQLAKRYIIADVVTRVLRSIYAGKATAADLTALLASYGGASVLEQIAAEIEQALASVQTVTEPRTVAVPYTIAPRDLIVDEIDLDPHSVYRRRF